MLELEVEDSDTRTAKFIDPLFQQNTLLAYLGKFSYDV